MKNAIERLCEAIAYPDQVPEGASWFNMLVDGSDVTARLIGKRIVLSRVIDRDENDLPKLVSLAVGRILKEEAVLAWDERLSACVLWQELPADAEDGQLVRFFEDFMNSSDWWVERAGELNAPPVVFPDIVIRP